jgi:hypothetical protein
MRERQVDFHCATNLRASVRVCECASSCAVQGAVCELKGAKMSATFGKPVKLTAWLRLFSRLVLVFLNTSRGYVVQFVVEEKRVFE